MRYLFGLLGILAGLAALKYTERVYRIVGRWDWAERLFTSGGTRSGIKLVAILTIILSVVFMTDTVEQFRLLILAPFRAAAPVLQ